MWGRFEDAMNDLEPVEESLSGENKRLEEELRSLGAAVPAAEEPALMPVTESDYKNLTYRNQLEIVGNLRKRNEQLKAELEKAQRP